jgi:hypothetical protein
LSGIKSITELAGVLDSRIHSIYVFRHLQPVRETIAADTPVAGIQITKARQQVFGNSDA